MKRTRWLAEELVSFVQWHESVLAQYPGDIQGELRKARTKFLAGVRS